MITGYFPWCQFSSLIVSDLIVSDLIDRLTYFVIKSFNIPYTLGLYTRTNDKGQLCVCLLRLISVSAFSSTNYRPIPRWLLNYIFK